VAIGSNVSWFVHLQETWLGSNVSWFAHLQETWLGNIVSWFVHLREQFLKTYYLNNIIFSLPVAVAMAPIRKAGIAIKIQPNEAENDRYLACLEVLQASTLWKYTCQGMPPNI
jgi:hypothetical protein